MLVDEFDFPDELKYLKGNLWIKEKKNSFVIGLTSLGASLAKEIVHIDLPDDDQEFPAGETIASYETIKSVTSITLPFDTKIKKINEKLLDNPTLINIDCYGDGWIMEIAKPKETKDIMNHKDATAHYKKIITKEKQRYKGIYD
jgi:glycine cleavage system H protein